MRFHNALVAFLLNFCFSLYRYSLNLCNYFLIGCVFLSHHYTLKLPRWLKLSPIHKIMFFGQPKHVGLGLWAQHFRETSEICKLLVKVIFTCIIDTITVLTAEILLISPRFLVNHMWSMNSLSLFLCERYSLVCSRDRGYTLQWFTTQITTWYQNLCLISADRNVSSLLTCDTFANKTEGDWKWHVNMELLGAIHFSDCDVGTTSRVFQHFAHCTCSGEILLFHYLTLFHFDS